MSEESWLKIGVLVRNLDGTILKVRRITEDNGVYCDDLKNYCATQLEYLGSKLAGYRFCHEYKVDGSRPPLEKDVEIAIRFDNKMVTGLRVGGFDFSADSHSGVYWKITDERYNPEKQWPETDERINNIGRNRTEDDMGHYDDIREAESTQSAQQADRPLRKYERAVKGVVIDVYDVLVAYNVTCPATAHAIKKLLMPGGRHAKTWVEDIDEAILSLQRAKELRQ